MFQHVYAESHPLIEEQAAWLKGYEASFEATTPNGGAE
jgi:pyruvate dehydrogenase E1 component alpha subunit